ncbi:hypothetical protein KIW84_066497 [Lathyrus oleraceus]|uniref:Uncharacterized protein n=1 Tax=Pisum sativum TaxID=3888 RepID=A0A9D4WFX0_PEA|nr:hypothetical protein KIW84_066497 [Pisum sativum]
MKKLWPSYTMRNDDFWEYQWAKHGRCLFPGFTQITYLREIMNAFESLHLFEALQIANIVPVDHRLPHRYYYRQDLIQDVGDRIGFHQIQPELGPRVTVGGWSSVLFRFWVSVNYCNRGIATHTEFLVRWDGVPYSEATWAWEPEDTLKTLYLHLNLEDKVVRGELGNDTHLGQKMKGMYDTSDIEHSKITKGTHRVRKRPA